MVSGGDLGRVVHIVLLQLTWLGVTTTAEAAGDSSRDTIIPIIDTHVHSADISLGLGYTFPSTFPDLGGRNWSLADYTAASSAVAAFSSHWGGRFGNPGAILMELEKSPNSREAGLAEAMYYQHVSNEAGGKVAGFVASASLESDPKALAEYLERLKRDTPAVRGVRQGIWKHNSSFVRSDAFGRGVCALAAAGLPFDVLALASQLDDVAFLARRCPKTRFNLNHLGYPPVSTPDTAAPFLAWADKMTRLATLPNVYAKLSGMPQASNSTAWEARGGAAGCQIFLPVINHTLAVFGARRINYAGNWFVLEEERWRSGGSQRGAQRQAYGNMFRAVTDALYAAGATREDAFEILGGTAHRFYGLDRM